MHALQSCTLPVKACHLCEVLMKVLQQHCRTLHIFDYALHLMIGWSCCHANIEIDKSWLSQA